MKDHLLKVLAFNDEVKAVAIVATEAVSQAQKRHDTWSAATAALGRTMIGTQLLATSLKGKEKMAVSIEDIKKLRAMTGAGLADVKNALNEAEGDFDKAKEILKELNLYEFSKLHPLSLSGGQKQRVAIGSAIAGDKELLIFDEPTSGLDYRHMLAVSKLMKRLSKEGRTVFIITHDPELLQECCDYLLFMENGKLAWSGDRTKENTERLNTFFGAEKTY